MFCSKCGSTVDNNAKFCKKCGCALPDTLLTTNEVTEQDKASFNQNQVSNLSEPKNRNWLIPSIILLTVCIISTLVYVWKFSNSSDAKQPEVASTQTSPSIKAPVTTEGLDLKSIVEKVVVAESDVYTTPSPVDVLKAFKPCKLTGEDGDWKGDCQLSSNSKFLVDENVKDNRNVTVTTNGARTMVNQILFSSNLPNNISNALGEVSDWNIKEIDCGQDKDIGDHRHIYTAKPNSKRSFIFETVKDGGSGGNFGKLLVHLTPIRNNKPCELVDLNLYMLEESLATDDGNNNKVEADTQAKAQIETAVAKQAENEGYEAILSCGRSTNENLNILACFAAGGGAQTELEIKNGSQYGMYKAYNISSLGREEQDGLHIHLQKHFSITAQNSHNILVLSLRIIDSKGSIMFQKSASQYGVISVSN